MCDYLNKKWTERGSSNEFKVRAKKPTKMQNSACLQVVHEGSGWAFQGHSQVVSQSNQMEFGMPVAVAISMKHYKFQKDWLSCHQVMTMRSFQKSNSRYVSSIKQERVKERTNFNPRIVHTEVHLSLMILW